MTNTEYVAVPATDPILATTREAVHLFPYVVVGPWKHDKTITTFFACSSLEEAEELADKMNAGAYPEDWEGADWTPAEKTAILKGYKTK